MRSSDFALRTKQKNCGILSSDKYCPGKIKIKNFRGDRKHWCAGNGLTDPAIQYGAYGDYALENKLIDTSVHARIQLAYPACKYAINMCNGHDWAYECHAALAYCQTAIFAQILNAADNVNVYDIRKKCGGPLCYDFSALDRYLAQPAVREALGVGNREWMTCDPTVYRHMMGDWMKNVRTHSSDSVFKFKLNVFVGYFHSLKDIFFNENK